ncbi:MAG TPA: hypothetical protein VF469_24340, partial [Kofleriaceae bacterium]
MIEADDGGRGPVGGGGGEVATGVDVAPAHERVVGDAGTGAAGEDEDLLDADHAEDAGRTQEVLGVAVPADAPPARDRVVVEQGAGSGVGELEVDNGAEAGGD